MPQSVVIACSPIVGLDDLSCVAREVASEREMHYGQSIRTHNANPQVQLSRDGRRDYLVIFELLPREDVAEEFSQRDEGDQMFRASAASLRYFVVNFSELATVRDFVGRLCRRFVGRNVDAWVDNDYGEVIAATDVVKHLDENPNWDWRPDLHRV